MKMTDRPIWLSNQTVLRSEGTDIAQVKFSYKSQRPKILKIIPKDEHNEYE
jgi:hypothetical protein